VKIVAGSNGYRLPTEAQWEYASRAGTTTAYNTGSNTVSDDTGWYSGNSGGSTREVGLKQPNAWGLYDMHGNVWERCWDWYGTYASEPQTDPRGADSGTDRVGRAPLRDSDKHAILSARRSFLTKTS
jgi:formylglycine-generating enzyme required for sulfatase activity